MLITSQEDNKILQNPIVINLKFYFLVKFIKVINIIIIY